MRAALITEFRQPLSIAEVPDPAPTAGGVVLRVLATGVCMSDWHAWMGHEDLPALPHVPGHEMVGVVESVGGDVVTVPFSIGCGDCQSCRAGHLNTCDRGFTPGFTAWGSFAERVAIEHADRNLVRLPDGIAPAHAAALGCRFVTAFRAVVDRGRLSSGEWLVIFGCGGVGLSAVMIGHALGARVVAVDLDRASLAMAEDLGATVTVDASRDDAVAAVRDVTDGGADVSVDAVGRSQVMRDSIVSLRKHGRHVQVGLMLAEHAAPAIPMEEVIMGELEILGTRGMPATDYGRVFDLLMSGHIDPGRLVTAEIGLDEVSGVLEQMGTGATVGVTVVTRF